jgi:hypothetical protein
MFPLVAKRFVFRASRDRPRRSAGFVVVVFVVNCVRVGWCSSESRSKVNACVHTDTLVIYE